MEINSLEDYRCRCGRLLFKGALSSSVVEIKCKKCGKLQSFFDSRSDLAPELLVNKGIKIEKDKKLQGEEA